MKREPKFSDFQRLSKPLSWTALLFSLIFLMTDCFHKQERTTTIYGTITDQNQQPVDSIVVGVQGLALLKYENLKQVLSDENGRYELVVEIPKKFNSGNVVIPFGSTINPKFQNNYKDYIIHVNDQPTDDCCTAAIGEKTKYDFQLIPK